jgi:hypothetical protein
MRKKLCKPILLITLNLFLMVVGATSQVASGGSYTLNQTVFASGGGMSGDALNNNYKIEGSVGQSSAGTFANGGTYSARGGFWTPSPFAPTAAGANINGRVLGLYGRGLPNVTLTLSGGNLLVPRVARTSLFGYFRFDDVEVGQVYVLSVESKRYGFGQNAQVISLMEDITDIIFQASWRN